MVHIQVVNINLSNFLVVFGGMLEINLINKVVYFGANGVTIFQSLKTSVTNQLTNKHCLFLVGIHYMAHKCNLVVHILSSLTFVTKIETLFACMYTFYN
jgi:hypothetical protein